MATEPRVTGGINVQALREWAEDFPDAPFSPKVLALLDAVEAAHDFYDGNEKSGDRLRAAFARFDFNEAA